MTAETAAGLTGLVRSFLEFEAEHELFALEIKGRRFWDCIRGAVVDPYLVQSLIGKGGVGPGAGTPGRGRRRSSASHATRWLTGMWRDTVEALRAAAPRDLAILNFDRWNVIDGRRVNMNCFPLVTALSPAHRLIVVDPVDMRRDVRRSYPSSVRVSAGFHTVDAVKARAVSYSAPEQAVFREIADKIRKRFDVPVDIAQLVRLRYSQHPVSANRFRRLFERHRPRAVMAAHRDFAAFEAAHEAGIPVIELQHSMISALNMAYNYPGGIRAGQVATMPDHVLTFGDYWNDKFTMPVRKVAVGYPFFEAKAEEVRRRLAGQAPTPARETNLVVISGYMAKAALVRATLELSELMPELTIYYKLKFSDYQGWRDRYPAEFTSRPNIKVIDNDDTALFEYFAKSAWVLGLNSGGLYEAMAFGATPFILKAGWYEECRDLYENGYAFLVEDAAGIAAVAGAGKSPARRFRREELYKSHATTNVVREVEQILANAV